MEKAILKTLIYFDIFDFPLKAWEIHKWLIGKTATFQQVEKALKKMGQGPRIKKQGDYYFLAQRRGLVNQRAEKEKVSEGYLKRAKWVSALIKIIPWIKLVGVSGSLSMMGSSKNDDIDLFIIASNNRIWLTRLSLILLTSLTGLRRQRREKLLEAKGKICINLILEEDNLVQNKKDIYRSHEVLQMRLLWQRQETYSKFLHANDWAFRYLPNWKSSVLERGKTVIVKGKVRKKSGFVDWLEELAKKLQLKIMDSPTGNERIENGALYFHPEDKGIRILEEYKRRISALK